MEERAYDRGGGEREREVVRIGCWPGGRLVEGLHPVTQKTNLKTTFLDGFEDFILEPRLSGARGTHVLTEALGILALEMLILPYRHLEK